MKRCAIIDDYQRCALQMADWSGLDGVVEIEVFDSHLGGEDAVVAALADFEIVCIMRERTPFPRSLFDRLPKLELLVTSGMRNLSIDMAAARDNERVAAHLAAGSVRREIYVPGRIINFVL